MPKCRRTGCYNEGTVFYSDIGIKIANPICEQCYERSVKTQRKQATVVQMEYAEHLEIESYENEIDMQDLEEWVHFKMNGEA